MTFVVLEGLDGSGKSTQTTRLADELGLRAEAEPTDGAVGRLLRQRLADGELEPEAYALLFAADRVQHQDDLQNCVCERYVYSSLAYQSAQGLDPQWLCEINRNAAAPDLAVLIDVDPETALERVHDGREATEVFEEREFLEKVEGEYLEIFRGEGDWGELREDYGFLDTELRVVEGDGSIEEVGERILGEVRDAL